MYIVLLHQIKVWYRKPQIKDASNINSYASKYKLFYIYFVATYLHNSKYGNCYTFNSVKDPNLALCTFYAGPLMGKPDVVIVVMVDVVDDDG